MLENMTCSLLIHEQVETTVAKAKELRIDAERVITCARKGERRQARRVVRSKQAYKKLFDVLAPRYMARPGGYTRIIRSGTRKGDNAELALVKLVE